VTISEARGGRRSDPVNRVDQVPGPRSHVQVRKGYIGPVVVIGEDLQSRGGAHSDCNAPIETRPGPPHRPAPLHGLTDWRLVHRSDGSVTPLPLSIRLRSRPKSPQTHKVSGEQAKDFTDTVTRRASGGPSRPPTTLLSPSQNLRPRPSCSECPQPGEGPPGTPRPVPARAP
jgi:hypothetical protein